MKKLILLLGCLVFAQSNEVSIQDIKCQKASKEVCGYDSWDCSALKCFIQTESLELAYQLYFEYLIQNEKRFSKERGEKEENNLSLYVYQTMQKFSLPKVSENVEIKHNDNQYYLYPSCHCVIKRTEKNLTLEFNKCQSENNVIIFKKEKNGFKITDKTETM